ncbi:MAG: 50S ribosomal protein L20 [Ferruginibacter sp.]
MGRKIKKRDYRSLWIARINAAVREEGMKYSEFMHKLAEKNITLNRKVLADLAMNEPNFPLTGFSQLSNATDLYKKLVPLTADLPSRSNNTFA